MEEILTPQEYTSCSGFYIVPDDRNLLAVNSEGMCINIHTGKIQKHYLNEKGYLVVAIRRSPCGKGKTYKVHRALALTFIKKPERHLDKTYGQLQVNHIDGDKQNNSLSNLEWVTSKENIQHSIDTGLKDTGRHVISRDIRDNSIIKYNSVTECIDRFNISYDKFLNHIYSKDVGTITKNWNVFKLDDDLNWPVLNDKQNIENSWDRFVYWRAHNTTTGEDIFADNLERLAGLLNISTATVSRYLNDKKDKSTYLDWVFEKREKLLEFENSNFIYSELIKRNLFKKTKVTNLMTSEVKTFKSCAHASRYYNIGRKRAQFAILTKGGLCENYKFEYVD